MKRRTELALHSAIALAIAGILPSTASYAQDSEASAEESGHRSKNRILWNSKRWW